MCTEDIFMEVKLAVENVESNTIQRISRCKAHNELLECRNTDCFAYEI